MKKTLVAFAALAAVGAASAQSTATVSGYIAAGYLKAIDGNKGLVLDSNSIKVSLAEDLGGGLKLTAATQIKGNSARGGNVTKEDSSIGVAGSFGSLVFANSRSSTTALTATGAMDNHWLWDNAYTSNGGGVFSRAPVDALTYTTPSMSGANVFVQYVEAKTDGYTTPAAKSGVLGVRYAAGPFSGAARFISSSGDAYPDGVRKTSFDLGAKYNLGVATIGLGYDSKRRGVATSSSTEKAAVVASVTAPLGPVTLGVNYGKRDVAKFAEVGVNYALSKRSSVYLDYGKATLADKSTNSQYNLVLVHNF